MQQVVYILVQVFIVSKILKYFNIILQLKLN